MNLAPPAPQVEPAQAPKANYTESAIASLAEQSEPARVDPPEKTDPATEYDLSSAPRSKPTPLTRLAAPTLLRAGVDFECYAAVLRGAPSKNFLQRLLPFIYDERDFISYSEAKRYVLIRGTTCFVYNYNHDPSPLYAMSLDEMKAIREDPDHPDKESVTISPLPVTNKPPKKFVTVLLKYKSSGKQAYQFTFDTESDPSLPKRFMDIVEMAGKKEHKSITASVIEATKEASKHKPLI